MIPYYRFYIDTPKQNGWHSYIVLKVGYKWVKLFSTERAKSLKIKRSYYDQLMKTAVLNDVSTKDLLETLANTAKAYKVTDKASYKAVVDFIKQHVGEL